MAPRYLRASVGSRTWVYSPFLVPLFLIAPHAWLILRLLLVLVHLLPWFLLSHWPDLQFVFWSHLFTCLLNSAYRPPATRSLYWIWAFGLHLCPSSVVFNLQPMGQIWLPTGLETGGRGAVIALNTTPLLPNFQSHRESQGPDNIALHARLHQCVVELACGVTLQPDLGM